MAAIFLALWFTLWVAGETQIGRFLNKVLVELPAVLLERVSRAQVILAVVVLGLVAIVILTGETDFARLAGLGLPDAALLLTSFEITSLLDAIAAVAAASFAMRSKATRRYLLTAARLFFRRPVNPNARKRSHQPRGRVEPANDDEDRAGVALESDNWPPMSQMPSRAGR